MASGFRPRFNWPVVNANAASAYITDSNGAPLTSRALAVSSGGTVNLYNTDAGRTGSHLSTYLTDDAWPDLTPRRCSMIPDLTDPDTWTDEDVDALRLAAIREQERRTQPSRHPEASRRPRREIQGRRRRHEQTSSRHSRPRRSKPSTHDTQSHTRRPAPIPGAGRYLRFRGSLGGIQTDRLHCTHGLHVQDPGRHLIVTDEEATAFACGSAPSSR